MNNFKITKTILENINEQNDRINECVDIVNGYTTDEETRVNQELQRQENELRREEQYNNNENRFALVNEQLEAKANKYDVRKSTSVQPINVSEMDTETKKLFTGGAVAVVGENAIGSENIKTNAVLNSKLELKSGAVLESLTKNIQLIIQEPTTFEFEHGIIQTNGSYDNNLDSAKVLNNVRTIKKYKVNELKIDLLSDNVMIKVIFYDGNGIYIENSGWLSKNPTNWSSGDVSTYTVKNSNIVLCLADTTLNNTNEFTATVEDMVSRIKLTEHNNILINGGFINNNHIVPKSLDSSVFKEEVLNDIFKDDTTILDGVMKLPDEFGKIPFEIVKENNRYNISLSSKQLNINPVTVYVSDGSSSRGLGLEKSQPITLKQVKQNFINNLYSSKNIRIKFIDNIYFMNSKSDFDIVGTGQDSTVTNLTLESENFTWIGYGKKNIDWSNYSENRNLYVTTETKKVSDLVDAENLKNNGLPNLYIKKTSLSEVTKEGEFSQIGNKVYVYPYSTNDITKINLIYGFDYSTNKDNSGIITIRKNSKGNIIFKNIGTFLDCLNLRDLKSLDIWYYFFNCRFHRGSMDSLALDGMYKAILIDCIADYASKDNFNYHSTSKDSVVIELNCKSYGAGQYKLDTIGVNTTKDSCNGSTAHNGMCVARFGCSYWDCEGSVVADVNNCVTYCVECSVKNILSTISNINYKAAYMLHDNRFSSVIYRPNDNHKNYIINCVGGGDNVTWGIRSEGMKIDVACFKGNTTKYQENSNDINLVNMNI